MIVAIYNMQPNYIREMVKYGLVSVISLAADISALVIFIELFQVHYLLAATLAFLLGLAVSYTLSRRFVFKNRKITTQSKEFTIFAIIGLLGLALNDLIIWFMTDSLAIYYLYSKLVATAIVFFWNFILRKRILY